MKTLITYIFTICLLLIFFPSCNDRVHDTNNSNSTDPKPICENCDDMVPISSYRLSNEQAQTYISNYRDYVDGLKDSLFGSEESAVDSVLIYGTHVHADELKQILGQSHGDDSLWVMMAMKPDGKTDMIFTLRSRNTTTGDECWSFFDFTQACPTSCPNL